MMIDKKAEKFLEELMLSSSPSGFEFEAAAVYRRYCEGFAESVRTDICGNTIATLNGDAKVRVMLAGHYDEIGFQVTFISDEGFLYFRSVGGIDKLTVPGTMVNVLTAKGKLPGVIGKKPIHLIDVKDRDKAIELKELWIDIGAADKKEAAKLVGIGDPVAAVPNFQRLGKFRFTSKGVDDKIGAFVVAETLRRLAKRKLNVAVHAVGTVQEELGLRGSTTSAFGIDPHIGLAVDVGFSSDVPDVDKKIVGEVSLGKGAFIERNADNNPILYEMLRSTAERRKIPFQVSCGHRASGGTDTAQMQMTRGGVATALVSVPSRYMHSPVEVCDVRDAESAISMLAETIAAMTGKESFVPGM